MIIKCPKCDEIAGYDNSNLHDDIFQIDDKLVFLKLTCPACDQLLLVECYLDIQKVEIED